MPNKATADVRAMIAQIAEQNAPRFAKWIERVAKQDPAKAADLFLRAIEYHIPKLARSEVTGAGGGPVQHEHMTLDPRSLSTAALEEIERARQRTVGIAAD